MRTERLDIRVPRNADYHEVWQLSDVDDAPIDLTTEALEMKVRSVAGQGAVVAEAQVEINDAAAGIFTVTISGSDFDEIDGEAEIVRLAYDLRMTSNDGVKTVPVAGQVILVPGASY